MKIRILASHEKNVIDALTNIHINTFQGFFLTFMGRGFLKQMYSAYAEHKESGVLVAEQDGQVCGFLAWSGNMSGLYKHMLRTRVIPFAWFSIGAFVRRPKAFFHIVRAFLKPSESRRNDEYIELSSIGVDPKWKKHGIGSMLIDNLKELVDFEKYAYITLETDAINNDAAILFYEKNEFVRFRFYSTPEGREMIEFRYTDNCMNNRQIKEIR